MPESWRGVVDVNPARVPLRAPARRAADRAVAPPHRCADRARGVRRSSRRASGSSGASRRTSRTSCERPRCSCACAGVTQGLSEGRDRAATACARSPRSCWAAASSRTSARWKASTSRCTPANPWASSARTARASPRCSRSSRAWRVRRAARSRCSGRVSALLELGSGFHPDYTGRENIYLSSAMMGLSHREARAKVDAIVDFADIGAHIDEPIKHYSSGMVVRLGFAVATTLAPGAPHHRRGPRGGRRVVPEEMHPVARGLPRRRRHAAALLAQHVPRADALPARRSGSTTGARAHFGDELRRDARVPHVPRGEAAQRDAKRRGGGPGQHAAHRVGVDRSARTDERARTFRQGETLVVQGVAYEPDERSPVLLFGIVRADGTPVYGSPSNEQGFVPVRIGRSARSPSRSASTRSRCCPASTRCACTRSIPRACGSSTPSRSSSW